MVAVSALMPVQARDIPDKALPTVVTELFEFAKKQGGFEEMCNTSMYECPQPAVLITEDIDDYAYGMYNPFKMPDVVQMSMGNAKPGTIAWNATLVHEFTHYFQWVSGKLGPSTLSCSNRAEIEIQAYTVMAEYLKSVGVDESMDEEKAAMRFDEALCLMSGGKP